MDGQHGDSGKDQNENAFDDVDGAGEILLYQCGNVVIDIGHEGGELFPSSRILFGKSSENIAAHHSFLPKLELHTHVGIQQ